MNKLRPSYEIIGLREASLDSLISEYPQVNFTPEFDKSKKASFRLATFSILMSSFNISSPLTISAGVASISIGDLRLFFALIFIYQLYTIKCLVDESNLSLLNAIEPLKERFCQFLLSRKAAMVFREKGVGGDLEFTMHGIEINDRMLHTPAIVHKFKSMSERERWREAITPDFVIDDFLLTSGQRVYFANPTIEVEDLDYWHKNKKRLYIKTKPMINHYYIPLIYSLIGALATLVIVFPSIKAVPFWLCNYLF